MARPLELQVDATPLGMWRVRVASVARRVLPRRAARAVARWAVARVQLDLRAGGARWRHHPHYEITFQDPR